jgi:hypothetical protein
MIWGVSKGQNRGVAILPFGNTKMGQSNGSGFSIMEEEVDRHSQHIEEKGKAPHDEKSNETSFGRRT